MKNLVLKVQQHQKIEKDLYHIHLHMHVYGQWEHQ